VAFAVGHLADYIESVELEPAGKIASFACGSVEFVGLGEKELGGGIDEWLILDEG
jgi:hypothetical protein